MSELRIPNDQKVAEIVELAELGKKARIIFHDLANHFTALSLSVGYRREDLIRTQIKYVSELLRCHTKNNSDDLFCPREIIQEILAIFDQKIRSQNIELNVGCQSNFQIFGNKSAFIHIVTNLVANAIDSFHSIPERQGRYISISTERSNYQVSLVVADNGSGIKPEIMGKIFDQNFTTKKTGSGIGLFATKEYVEKNFKGKIRVESSAYGSKFTITIPTKRHGLKQNRRHHMSPVLLVKK